MLRRKKIALASTFDYFAIINSLHNKCCCNTLRLTRLFHALNDSLAMEIIRQFTNTETKRSFISSHIYGVF